ncbi:MAG: DNA-processing protein DprA [Gemmatimonadota bacterium]
MAALSSADREAVAFIALEGVKGLGVRRIRTMWEEHGSGCAALDACPGRPDVRAAARIVERARRMGVRTIPLGHPEYPTSLYDLHDPPPVLYVRGAGWPGLDSIIAIVGTRRASPYGRRIAARLARDLARWGWTVVSGMAVGIDAAAHGGSLDEDGQTIGVLGSGHEHEYPPGNRALYARMKRRGWLISEFPPPAAPFRASFPRRNRLIAALSRGVIVVEAGEKSGALNTASHGLDLGREIMAVPARVGDRAGVGTLRMLRDGAALVTDVRDVFDALGWVHDDPTPERSAIASAGRDAWLVESLGADELTASELALTSGRKVGETATALGRLEIDGKVARSLDGRFYLLDRISGRDSR